MGEAIINGPMLFDATGAPIPVGVTRKPDPYAPDLEVYEVDQSRSPIRRFLEDARSGSVEVEAYLLGVDGKAKRVDLNEAKVQSAVERPLCEVAAEALREAALLREGGPENGDAFSTDDSGWYKPGSGPDEFLALGNGPFNQQLYLHDYWDMLAKCFWAGTHDAIAKRGLQILVDFVLARGFTVSATDPRVQDEWDRFWAKNRGDERISTWLLDMFRDGNRFDRFFPQGDSPPRMVPLEPSTIWEIVTDPENVDDVKLYWQQYQTRYQLIGDPATGTPTTKYVVRHIPADEVVHTKLNASATEVFGRSDLFPTLGWLKRLRDYYDAETLKSIIQAAFAWDFTLKGGGVDVAAVQNYAAQQPPPDLKRPGQAMYHNEAVEVKTLQADKLATSSGAIGVVGDGLLGLIAIALGLAKDYFGITSRGALGSDPSKTATEPAVKHFEARQRVVAHWLERVAEKVVRIAQDEGRLPKTVVVAGDEATIKEAIKRLRNGDLVGAFGALKMALSGGKEVPLDPKVVVTFPPLVDADRSALIEDAERAEANNYLSKRQAATIVGTSFKIDDYDFDEVQAEIESEGRQMIAKSGEQVPKGYPTTTQPVFPPGDVINPNAAADDGGAAPTEARETRKTITFEFT
ncbi:hypothetical protein EPN42_05630 [bacterium]|nr:MAG: hypothetical protein EPN42_05630 [bacterium]